MQQLKRPDAFGFLNDSARNGAALKAFAKKKPGAYAVKTLQISKPV